MSLAKKVAVITGGSGMGLDAAAGFLRAGASVVLNGRSALRLENAAKSLDPSGERIATVPVILACHPPSRRCRQSLKNDLMGSMCC